MGIYIAKESIDDLLHYGTKYYSGRYPYGSGEIPYQHDDNFLRRVSKLREEKFTYTDPKTGKKYTGDTAIAKSMNMSSTEFRTKVSYVNDKVRAYKVSKVKELSAEGMTPTEIAKKLGFNNESSVRNLLNAESEMRMNKARSTAEALKKLVDEKGMIDVGDGVEKELNISKTKLNEALYILEMDGYNTFGGRVPTGPNRSTTMKVLCPPGTQYKIQENGKKTSSSVYDYDQIHNVKDYISRDGGETIEKKFNYPASMDSKRLAIRYTEDGGSNKDGVIELRRGVADLSLGESRYSQVRILVDNNKYLKGMAVYGDDSDFPKGVDVIFNTNKSKSVDKMNVLKDIKKNPENPFGSLIKDADQGGQYWYTDKDGTKKLGLINKRSDQGDWNEWADKLSAQFLSKQSTALAQKQLGIAIKDKTDEYNEILSLTNPTVKKKLLTDFANNCDSAAVHLYAAALPRQKYKVILPVNSLKDTEVYAPTLENGTKVALIRYPHGGTFEIPILTVNNKNKEAQRMIGNDSIDAVGITKKVADRFFYQN